MECSQTAPYCRGIPRSRGRGLGPLTGTIALTAFPILRKYLLPAVKRIGRDALESAILEMGKVLSGKSSTKKV